MSEENVPEVHGNIAGVALSEDGRHLYVGLLKDWNSRYVLTHVQNQYVEIDLTSFCLFTEGYILAYERAGAPSLRELAIRYIQNHRDHWC